MLEGAKLFVLFSPWELRNLCAWRLHSLPFRTFQGYSSTRLVPPLPIQKGTQGHFATVCTQVPVTTLNRTLYSYFGNSALYGPPAPVPVTR